MYESLREIPELFTFHWFWEYIFKIWAKIMADKLILCVMRM